MLWTGRAHHPGQGSQHVNLVEVQFLNVGGWLCHGKLALESGAFLWVVAEHRLILAWVGKIASQFAVTKCPVGLVSC